MSRKKKFNKRKIKPDIKFNNLEISKFINILMLSGKKNKSEKIIYKALYYIKSKNKNPIKIFLKAIENCKPLVEIKNKKIGGSNYQIPVEVNLNRRISLSMKWIKKFALKRKERFTYIKIANELIDASENKGSSINKKIEIYKMAESNKAFSNFNF
ncbi:30S ribosomal subunit protein S7 [Candidatus Zinderia insecticola CARI]|uniref:Small ribosomal subunit protein uS7 n=1 Tax=Zinderia insecticola (strain CARI) TaxID=871271 RepID=E0TJ50_ZINIC|nr:30S ribosomal subunit protein S7 [Candidatus Zinderia insecticola CARI]